MSPRKIKNELAKAAKNDATAKRHRQSTNQHEADDPTMFEKPYADYLEKSRRFHRRHFLSNWVIGPILILAFLVIGALILALLIRIFNGDPNNILWTMLAVGIEIGAGMWIVKRFGWIRRLIDKFVI